MYQEFYNGQLTYATISTPEQIKYEFNAQGKLITIRNNANYHSISITYLNEDRISLLKDSVGNQIVFMYNNNQLSQTELKLIQPNGSYKTVEKRVYNYSLTLLNSVVVYMNYDKTSNVLKQMSTLYYSYQTGRLTTAYSSTDNYKVIYTHNLSGKVTNITLEDDGKILSKIRINHSFLETTYTNHKNEWVTYYFDNYGHTINVIDSNVNASYYRYANPFSYINIHSNLNGYDLIDQAPNYYINHKIIESSDVIKQTHNYISNHGFENINGLAP
ncbi:MAG: hypothetical protein GX312_02690 [Candidatus Phytoplasma sp.]|nr:hypothetical protein [Phytoplasma sp.]